MNRLRRLDWDAVAGIVAAVAALVLHLLHLVDEEVVLAIVLVILAIILIRDLRREDREEQRAGSLNRVENAVASLRAEIAPPDAILIGPERLRVASERFAQRARGEMLWFNVCLLMFEPQSLFDVLLRPAIENRRVSSIQFVLDHGERERWERSVRPKAARCKGSDKLLEPRWTELRESTSFILAEQDPEGQLEAHVSFWGEPFMSHSTGGQIPRYIFHVQAHSELIRRLAELGRSYRLSGGAR